VVLTAAGKRRRSTQKRTAEDAPKVLEIVPRHGEAARRADLVDVNAHDGARAGLERDLEGGHKLVKG